MKIDAPRHVYGWYNDKRVVTEYTSYKPEKGNIVYRSQRWFWPIHIYDNKAKIQDYYMIGKNLDVRV